MSLADQWTLTSFRDACRRELLDPQAQWWSVQELDSYINQWQETLQSRFEFKWAVATLTQGLELTWNTATNTWNSYIQSWDSVNGVAVATVTLSAVAPDMMRVDAIYFTPGGTDTSIQRLPMRSKQDLDRMAQDWRSQGTLLQPELCYQDNAATISFWPPPPGIGTYIFEYPVLCTFAASTSTLQLPAWTRYDCVSYVAYRALARFGPNQDMPKALRYRRKHERSMKRFQKYYMAYFPERSEMLRPGRQYAGNILVPRARKWVRP